MIMTKGTSNQVNQGLEMSLGLNEMTMNVSRISPCALKRKRDVEENHMHNQCEKKNTDEHGKLRSLCRRPRQGGRRISNFLQFLQELAYDEASLP